MSTLTHTHPTSRQRSRVSLLKVSAILIALVLAVPVFSKTLEGVLVVDTKEQFGFTTKQLKLISSLADQIAWHLSRERNADAPPESGLNNMPQVVEWCQSLSEAEDRSALSDRLVQVPETVSACDAVARPMWRSAWVHCRCASVRRFAPLSCGHR